MSNSTDTSSMDKNIKFITIIPKNQFLFKMYINDQEEGYSKSLKEGEPYLLSLLNRGDRVYLNELIYSFIPFIIDVEKKEVIELQIDKEKELEQIRKELKKRITGEESTEEGVDKVKDLAYNDSWNKRFYKK